MPLSRQFVLMLIIDILILMGLLYYRTHVNIQYQPYPHFLVDYHFGFIKRAFIGQVFAFWFPRIPLLVVHVFSALIGLVSIGAFLLLFRRDIGFRTETLPLLAFTAGSPFFFKNFFHNLGYFDVMGAIVAILALLLPLGLLSLLFFVIACTTLLLIHHLHFLLYIPTILLILHLRANLIEGAESVLIRKQAPLLALLAGMVFVMINQWGTPSVTEAQLVDHMRSRAVDAVQTYYSSIWYSTLPRELASTAAQLVPNLAQAPIYVLLLLLHFPLLLHCRNLLRSLPSEVRREVVRALLCISLGYGAIFILLQDYSRWVSNWMVCLWLLVHLAQRIAPQRPQLGVESDLWSRYVVFAWLVTIIPRVGTVTPF